MSVLYVVGEIGEHKLMRHLDYSRMMRQERDFEDKY
jgi:hypothetical protein